MDYKYAFEKSNSPDSELVSQEENDKNYFDIEDDSDKELFLKF